MNVRHVFLRIEPLASYTPLAPVPCGRRYGRDCMFNQGHELGRLDPREITEATLDALIYREYLDPDYSVPRRAKLVEADLNEPPWDRRIPGAVLYAQPGERLFIHVRNADPGDCHSFHLHGLRYGIDSDGAWPFGIAGPGNRRSDEIPPGADWTYVFDATPETVGAWPFHDHSHNVQQNVNRGLFGGLIVRDSDKPCADHEAPIFIHQLQGTASGYFMRSDQIGPTQTYDVTPQMNVFDHPGVCNYYCAIHGTGMSGQITILPNDPTQPAVTHTVTIQNLSFGAPITIRIGDTVRWVNNDGVDHVVFSPGGGKANYCLNGRTYVGNTPTIVGETGETIRWYVFNLDLATMWHNFHPHSARWQLPSPPGGAGDVHGLSPVETFVADTTVPPALRLPPALEALQLDPPAHACRIRVRGDFLFHCHVEEHMMQGLAGLVRARQQLWLTEEVADKLTIELPYDNGRNDCPNVDFQHCATRAKGQAQPAGMAPSMMGGMGAMGGMGGTPTETMDDAHLIGRWELLPCDSEVLAVHGAVLRTGKVLFVSGSGNDRNTPVYRSVVFDYERGARKLVTTPTDVFCGGHAFLPDGRLLYAGGTKSYDAFKGETAAYLFDPILEDFIRIGNMAGGRWYPALVSLGDSRILAVSGWSVSGDPVLNETPEDFAEPSGWSAWSRNVRFPLYPHLFLLKDGRLFYSGGHVFGTHDIQPGWLNPTTEAFAPMASGIPASFDLDHRDQSATVLLPPAQSQEIMIMGGGDPGIKAVHRIKPLATTPKFTAAASLHFDRIHLNAVLLPDRTVFVSGGEKKSEQAATAALESEIYDPVAGTWRLAAKATVPRMYHSIALLLPDGRVLTAGSNPEANTVAGGELRLELYHPPYLFRGTRPFIDHAPTEIQYDQTIEIHTPQARKIKWINLTRPMATTHSWDSNQRLVDVPFKSHDLCTLQGHIPNDACLIPPGWYMLTITDHDDVPSYAHWVHLSGGGQTKTEPTPPKRRARAKASKARKTT
jgi:FtsP/CotA-like multicopper oxidase with cupredoxin domain